MSAPAFTASFERLKMTHSQLSLLKCPSIVAELNVMSILTVFNMALRYHVPLHKETGRGAYNNIGRLGVARHLSSTAEADYTSARGMVALYHQKVADLMGALKHIHAEVPHKPRGRTSELVRRITKILK